MSKAKSDDKILAEAKTKLGQMINKESDVDKVVSLVNSLSKLIAVELKMSEGDWGSGLGSGDTGG